MEGQCLVCLGNRAATGTGVEGPGEKELSGLGRALLPVLVTVSPDSGKRLRTQA